MTKTFAIVLVAALSARAAYEEKFEGVVPVPVTVRCREPGGWQIGVSRVPQTEKGLGELEIRLTSKAPAVPPLVSVVLELPQRERPYFWRPGSASVEMPPNWRGKQTSRLSSWMPVYAYFSEDGRNRFTMATDEVKRDVDFWGGLQEEGAVLPVGMDFFASKEASVSNYTVHVRFDFRDIFYADSIRAASDWAMASAKLTPAAVPDDAFEPLYSSWYCFHQDVFDRDIEAECARAAKLGMKVLIVDDGWQTDDNNRGYACCGDWQVSTNRFPDMATHVRRIHALGMKYMVWYSVPFVGHKSANYARFRGKYLKESTMGAAVLDPRFPDVREFLVGTYEKALRDWDIDGFKLDFIDSFTGEHENETGGGRDIDTVPEAVDLLMKDVYARLRSIKPDVLVEFRQQYIGPGIRQYGNMFRVGDCPGSYSVNRAGIARLRLTSGSSAVHADMLEWHPSEKAEDAARFVLNCLFGTIQYSMMLRTLPEEHLRMMRHWICFTKAHRGALLKGEFRPYHPELNYPLVEGWDTHERIVGVYASGLVARVSADGRTTHVVNATKDDYLTLDLPAIPKRVAAFDTFGNPIAVSPVAKPGLVRVTCPKSGYLTLAW